MSVQDNGVPYVPRLTDFYDSDEMELLLEEFDTMGIVLYDMLWCKIFRDNGYYYDWNDDKAGLMCRRLGKSSSRNSVHLIVNYLVKRSLFDDKLFNSVKVLTSADIQRQWVKCIKDRLRKAVAAGRHIEIIEDYWLLSKNETPVGLVKVALSSYNSTEKHRNSTENMKISTEKSVNKIKVNKTKVNKTKTIKESSVVVVVDDKLKSLQELFEQNIATVSPLVLEEMQHWLEDVDVSLIEYAIAEAVFRGHRNWNYIKTILKNQFNSGNKSRLDVENSKRKGDTSGSSTGNSKQEDDPYAGLGITWEQVQRM